MMSKWFWTLLLLLLAQPTLGEEVRQTNLEILKAKGFIVAPNLPTSRHAGLRPQEEIEKRMDALQALVLWVTAPPGHLDDKALQERALSGDLAPWLSEEEKSIFRLEKSQAKEQYLDSIGWQMENIWALAWVLGYSTEPALSGQLEGDLARDLILGFCVKGERRLRPLREVQQMEDLFYCAHNAVRSAQAGRQTVPEGFHPVLDGGGVHERRHALTWCLSPGVSWEDTDLST
jgi:uncharacterized protein DUF4272